MFSSFSTFQIFFSLFDSENGEVLDNNFYIYSKKEYEIIKESISFVSIQYIDSNLMNVSQRLNDSFDFIYLSNIYNYLSYSLKNFSEFLKKNLYSLLKDRGELIFNYYAVAGEIRDSFFPADAYSYMSSISNECHGFNSFFDVQKYEVLASGYGASYFTKDLILSLKK